MGNTVGIYDDDYFKKRGYLSLEVMKIANYWASKRKMVSITSDPNPALFSDFYYASDFGDIKDVPSFRDFSNVTFIGHTFWKRYKNQLPPEIENMEPRPEVYPNITQYLKFEKNTKRNAVKAPRYTYGGLHFRLDDNEEHRQQLIDSVEKLDFPAFFCYNYNIENEKNWYEFMQQLESIRSPRWRPPQNFPARFFFKFPIGITNDTFDIFRETQRWIMYSNSTWRFKEVLSLEQYREAQAFYREMTRLKSNRHFPLYYTCSSAPPKPYEYWPTLDTNRTILSRRMKDFLFQIVEMRNGRSLFSLKFSNSFFNDEGWRNFFSFLFDYANYNTVHYYYKREKCKREIPEGQIINGVRFGRDMTIREYLWYRDCQVRISQEERWQLQNCRSKMELIVKTQPSTNDIFCARPSEVSKYDWTRN